MVWSPPAFIDFFFCLCPSLISCRSGSPSSCKHFCSVAAYKRKKNADLSSPSASPGEAKAIPPDKTSPQQTLSEFFTGLFLFNLRNLAETPLWLVLGWQGWGLLPYSSPVELFGGHSWSRRWFSELLGDQAGAGGSRLPERGHCLAGLLRVTGDISGQPRAMLCYSPSLLTFQILKIHCFRSLGPKLPLNM